MKGTIANSVAEMVTEKFGKDKWEKILSLADLPKDTVFFPVQDFDDGVVMKVFDSLCHMFDIPLAKAADIFGEYWVTVYAPKYYHLVYEFAPTAREFLLGLDDMHKQMTKSLPGAHPPHFEFEWQGEKALIVKYYSSRGLIDFVVGLAKGVGKFYQEPLKVTKIANDRVEVIFLE